MDIFASLLALSLLIFIHELGHFLAARFFGVKVERFSIGFGSIIAKKECCDTEWALSAIPLGGYVKMKGQDDLDPLKRSGDPDSYTTKAPWQRIIILLAGPFANFFLAFVLFSAVAIVGTQELAPEVGKVMPHSPAAHAGLKKGDRIIAINEQEVHTWQELSKIISNSPNQSLYLRIDRQGKILTLRINPKIMESKNIFGEKIFKPMIGISPAPKFVQISHDPLEALKIGFDRTIETTRFILLGIWKMIEGTIPAKELGGVISIMDITAKASQSGVVALLSIAALISVNLGVINLLPIPALDGGHIFFTLLEWIRGKALSEEVLYRLTLAGWIFLIGLMGLGLYNDINRLIGVHSG